MGHESSLVAQFTIGKILLAVAVIGGTSVFLKWLNGFLDRLASQNVRLRFLLRQIEPPLRIVTWFGALLIAAQIVAPSKDAFLAALGSAALAIGLGLQDLIKNLIGGLVIVADRPYQAGDRIRMGQAYGEVVQIGLRSTKILTSTGSLVTVPNSVVLTSLIFNANAGVAESMVSVEIFIPDGASPDEVLRLGREVAVSCPYTRLGRPILLELNDKGTNSRVMRLTVNAYVYDHRFEPAMHTDVLRRAQRELLARGILRKDLRGD
jgi:small-conductance mechanosensitive channel